MWHPEESITQKIHDYDARKPSYASYANSAASLFELALRVWHFMHILYYILYFGALYPDGISGQARYSRVQIYRSSPAVSRRVVRAFGACDVYRNLSPRKGFVKIAGTRFPLSRGMHASTRDAVAERKKGRGVKRSGGARETEWNAKRRWFVLRKLYGVGRGTASLFERI